MTVIEQLRDAVIKGQASQAKALTEQALQSGLDPYEVLEKGLLLAMQAVSDQLQQDLIYITDVLLSSRAMHAGMHILKPHLSQCATKTSLTAVIGTVAGDLHDIGKNLVAMMLRSKGIEVIDLGIDVPIEEFLRAIITYKPQILCISALLTTTMPALAKIMEALQAMGLRDQVKVMVGGAPVTPEYARAIQADGYAPDALLAATEALRLMGYKDSEAVS